jgi:hypothetical protein
MAKLINLTGHDVVINGERIEPRLRLRIEFEKTYVDGLYVFQIKDNTPKQREDVLYIVSEKYASVFRRKDIVFPVNQIRDINNKVIACGGLGYYKRMRPEKTSG